VTTFDLLLWAVFSGADELAHALWCRAGSPLRTALLVHEMCRRLQNKHTRRQQLIELASRFSQSAIGVLDRLPNQEVARKILLAREDIEVADGGVLNPTAIFSTLGGAHGSKSSLLDMALEFQNKEFLAHRYCQSVFDDWWKGRSPQCGRVRFDQDSSSKLMLLQLCFPFLRILHVKSNDLCTTAGTRTAALTSAPAAGTAGRVCSRSPD